MTEMFRLWNSRGDRAGAERWRATASRFDVIGVGESNLGFELNKLGMRGRMSLTGGCDGGAFLRRNVCS
jgi:hypothetical protein